MHRCQALFSFVLLASFSPGVIIPRQRVERERSNILCRCRFILNPTNGRYNVEWANTRMVGEINGLLF